MVRLDGTLDVLPELHSGVSGPDLHKLCAVGNRLLINAVDEYHQRTAVFWRAGKCTNLCWSGARDVGYYHSVRATDIGCFIVRRCLYRIGPGCHRGTNGIFGQHGVTSRTERQTSSGAVQCLEYVVWRLVQGKRSLSNIRPNT